MAEFMTEFIRKHPIIFSVIVIIIFFGHVRSLYITMNKRKKK